MNDAITVSVIGLGYVGLPLAVEMSKYFPVIGFDINQERITQLRNFSDPNGEVNEKELKNSKLVYTNNEKEILKTNFVIVAVPTPIDEHKSPDLTPLIKASETVGRNLAPGAIVVYESTVYPGVTEDECVPILEKMSGLKWKKDFFVGYSPERINPGDKVHTFASITKVVSGDTEQSLERIALVYGSVVKAGIYKAASIKIAEAAKVIENTQRDINIALMNELRIIFDKMGVSTKKVLEAAKTKWNFLPFEPGLVGGHCIGVDPYYLAYKAEELGHHPQIIMAGRRINDDMGRYFARELIKRMIHEEINIKGSKVLILGITFKENVPDIRNSRVIDIINELKDFGMSVDVWDPFAHPRDVKHEYNLALCTKPQQNIYDGILLAVKHFQFLDLGVESLKAFGKEHAIFYDIKEVL